MQKFRGFGAKAYLLLVLLIGFSGSLERAVAHDKSCFYQLKHPSSEVYLSSRLHGVSELPHKANAGNFSKRGQAQRLAILEGSQYKDLYLRILQTAYRDANLHRLSLFVLSELEPFAHKIENFEYWLQFLEESNTEQLHHRIYEGLHAAILMKTKHVHVAFEPRRGFFNDAHSSKSMDLKVVHAESEEILSFKEIKRIYKHHSVQAAAKSIVGKAAEIRPKVGDEIELAGIIYIGFPLKENVAPETLEQRREDFARTAHGNLKYIQGKVESRREIGIDSILMIDVELERFYKIYVHGHKATMTEGDYPIRSLFGFLQ